MNIPNEHVISMDMVIKSLKENEEVGFDYKYFRDQVDSLSNTLMEFEQEISVRPYSNKK